MLNRKNLMILVGILAVLVVISLVQSRRHDAATSRPSAAVILDGALARADLSRVTVGHGSDAEVVVLDAGSEHWLVATVHGAKADHERIDTLLRSLSGLRGEFRSDSREVLADYGFSDTTTVSLRGYDSAGAEVFAVEVGSKPSSGQGNFVKRPESAEVYLTTVGLLANLGLWGGTGRPESRQFLDLQAFSAERSEIEMVELTSEGKTMALTKEYAMIEPAPDDTVNTDFYADPSSWEWRLDDGTMAVKTKADGVLGAVVNVRAQDVADPGADPAAYGLDSPARTLVLTRADGTTTSMVFGSQREADGSTPGGYYTRIGDDSTIWVVGTYNVDNMFKSREDLLPDSE